MTLPRSKKTRALLGYLVATARSHTRQRLCELLWDGPSDPRAALRWSLTKLRPILGERGLVTDRDHVSYVSGEANVDVHSIGMKEDPAHTPTETLQALHESFRGEFLDGLDLPSSFRYQQWLVAQREELRSMRVHIIQELISRFSEHPETALRYARELVLLDPMAEEAHAVVMRVLGSLGRTEEALQQYESCRNILKAELQRTPGEETERIRRSIFPTPLKPASSRVAGTLHGPAPLVGRIPETLELASWVEPGAGGRSEELIFITGEPGIGKTRLLAELALMVQARGGRILTGRAFEAEMIRPYGPWIDALRSIGRDEVPAAIRPDLRRLLPELDGPASDHPDRNQLFDAVSGLLGSAAERSLTLLVLDDLQWFDEASAALLHFVARDAKRGKLLIACSARSAELSENSMASTVVHALNRENRVLWLRLLPLTLDEVRMLVADLGKAIPAERVYEDSQGNPLFALEVSAALLRGSDSLDGSLESFLTERLRRLGPQAREVTPWAAALGRNFDPEILSLAAGISPAILISGLEELERHEVIRAGSSGSGGYDFVHDVMRQAAYRQMTEPVRRLLHLNIARALARVDDPVSALAGEIAHHAALGGDSLLAANAYVEAGERCLRIFAGAEAAELVQRGLEHALRLSSANRISLELKLHHIYVLAGVVIRDSEKLNRDLMRLTLEAESEGLGAEVVRGYHILGVFHEREGNFEQAAQFIMKAADASRDGDAVSAVRQLANAGRCLALLGRDIPRASALLTEAKQKAEAIRFQDPEIPLGIGLVQFHFGQYSEATASLEEALHLARERQDTWRGCICLIRLVMIELEQGRPEEALDRCRVLHPLAAKMGEGSEGPFAQALEAVSELLCGIDGAAGRVESALSTLRSIDTKGDLAYVLILLAEADLAGERPQQAHARAEEAVRLATAVGRRSDFAIAVATVARASAACGDSEGARCALKTVMSDLSDATYLSKRARESITRSASAVGIRVPSGPTVDASH
ncbi:MAG: AAA family ATPase [Acidobacteriota bacterium]